MNSKFETRTKKTAAIARPCCWYDGPKERGCEEVSYEGMQKRKGKPSVRSYISVLHIRPLLLLLMQVHISVLYALAAKFASAGL